jgi:[glutamine synthetase] adenylyltransferase / [glutamine synthetase]-adenylyl-L-tyrosine phosphorylase
MPTDDLKWLEQPEMVNRWLDQLGIADTVRGATNLVRIVRSGLTFDLQIFLVRALARLLPDTGDPGAVLNNLDRFFEASRSPHSLVALFERDSDSLPTLLRIFSVSQFLADQLIADPESFDFLRLTEGQAVPRDRLLDELVSEVMAMADEGQMMRSLRHCRQRELLRIAYGDFIGHHSLEIVTEQLSFLAEALTEAALLWVRRDRQRKKPEPRHADGSPIRFSILALGKLGGTELNYSSDIDLIFLADFDEGESNRHSAATEYFERLATQLIKTINDKTPHGRVYRVDMRLRPLGGDGALVCSPAAALNYYESLGRTWERQAYLKARVIAGDHSLGQRFLDKMQPWIFRRYLSRADIVGIGSLKRLIEKRSQNQTVELDVKLGPGGIRDIEFVVQFLQLLHSGDLKSIRSGNTLTAISKLADAGILTMQERAILDDGYRLLRRVEHYLQIMFDLQTHSLPDIPVEIRKLALRMDFRDQPAQAAEKQLRLLLEENTSRIRRIVDHLLHRAFTDQGEYADESDLILEPSPSEEMIERVLSNHSFTKPDEAYRLLMALSKENVSFLSNRRCRHFLAAIAPKLLASISRTPFPDRTLAQLSNVSDSLGGKAVLWELFSFNPPSMQLYVRLCATSPYLVELLTGNPGMIDELLDSLLMDRLPQFAELEDELTELCRNADDIEPILLSYRNFNHLRVGVRDILGKEGIVTTHATLSDIAEVCLRQVVQHEYRRLIRRYGVPMIETGPRGGEVCDFTIVALGKLGGREPNYHSDLDILFLFEGDGHTQTIQPGSRFEPTTNRHFYNQLSQRVIQTVSKITPWGRLYEIDARLRPTGQSGQLAIAVDDLTNYFEEGQGQLWERQALCKARTICGGSAIQKSAMNAIARIIQSVAWNRDTARDIFEMRLRLQQSATPQNLKRGEGGTLDIEFIIQALQIKLASSHPDIVRAGTLAALEPLVKAGAIQVEQAWIMDEGYRFLRGIESALRLMNTVARHDFPTDTAELRSLEFLLGVHDSVPIAERCHSIRRRNRLLFNEIFKGLQAE